MLTLLALLTGLAAFGAPAHAAVIDMFGPQVQSGSERDGEERRVECRQRKDDERGPVKREDIRDCPVRKQVRIYVPTVMFGPDRAYE